MYTTTQSHGQLMQSDLLVGGNDLNLYRSRGWKAFTLFPPLHSPQDKWEVLLTTFVRGKKHFSSNMRGWEILNFVASILFLHLWHY